ncbi:chaplin [Streptomyces sp. NPDC006997]|uniref:chaplin n=1 Tax=Streptomyces sp. NPDC006997 TaxID=3155356 RepID=UPI0033C2EFBB
MRRVTRNGVIAVVAASGAMAVTCPAYADSAADGAAVGSPGVVSGNTVQLPVHVPVNVCGDTVNVVGLLNPAAGNRCATGGGPAHQPPAGASAHGHEEDAPGLVSGNGVRLPVHLPVNVSGNAVSVVGVGNPAVGNESTHTSEPPPRHPAPPEPPERPTRPEPAEPPRTRPVPPPAAHPATPPPAADAALADTGADAVLPAALGATAMVLGGAALVRRSRPRVTR